MITELNTMEWARLRDFAKERTVREFRLVGRETLLAVAKRADVNGRKYVSEAIARECEKWCKQ